VMRHLPRIRLVCESDACCHRRGCSPLTRTAQWGRVKGGHPMPMRATL
jgi:hypothetical protein